MKAAPSLLAVLYMLFATPSFGDALPDWAKPLTMNVAVKQLAEWMKDGPFYKIQKMESSEFTSGQNSGVNAKITFDDSEGCKEQEVIANCFPIEASLLCLIVHFGCKQEKIHERVRTVVK